MHLFKQDIEDLELKKDQELASLKRVIEKLQREKDDCALRFEEEKHKSLRMGN